MKETLEALFKSRYSRDRLCVGGCFLKGTT